MIKNTEWNRVWLSLGVTVVFTFVCIIALTSMDGMGGGFAIAFVAFFLAISGVAVAVLFITRAREMDAILKNNRVLAHWVYPEVDAQKSAEREFQEYKGRNYAMFILIGGMLAVVALFFLVFVEDGGVETAAILLGLLVLLYIVSRVTPVLEHRRVRNTPHEAYIAENGIIYEGAIYPFRSFLMRMTGVRFRPAKKDTPDSLVFSFTQLVGLYIISPFAIVVPVPDGEKKTALDVIQNLGGKISEEPDDNN